MTKQNSSKKTHKHSHEGSPTVQKKPTFKRKKMGSEIDQIFAGKKRKKPEEDKKADTNKPVKAPASNVRSHDQMSMARNGKIKSVKENGLADPSSQKRKRTGEGLAIYTEEELGIGKPDAGEFIPHGIDARRVFMYVKAPEFLAKSASKVLN